MEYTLLCLIGSTDATLPQAVLEAIAAAGFERAKHTVVGPEASSEPPLSVLITLKDNELLKLAKLHVMHLHDLRYVQWQQVWYSLERFSFITLLKVMRASGAEFNNLVPADLDCLEREDWERLGLNVRLAHLLLRNGIMGTQMLAGMERSHLGNIHNMGVKGIGVLLGLREQLIAKTTPNT